MLLARVCGGCEPEGVRIFEVTVFGVGGGLGWGPEAESFRVFDVGRDQGLLGVD